MGMEDAGAAIRYLVSDRDAKYPALIEEILRTAAPLPEPITGPLQTTRLDIRRHDRLGGVIHEYRHTA
jgi:hypothetical protein